MSKVFKKFLDIGTGLSDINAQSFPAIYTPTNYTPNQVTTEGNDKISAHLKGIDTSLGNKQPLDADLTAIAALTTTGILARTAVNTWTNRVILATSPIIITNGNGVSGNPEITHANSGVTIGTYGSASVCPTYTVTLTGHISNVANVNIRPIELTYYSSASTTTTTTSSSTFASLGVSLTPPAGTYLFMLDTAITCAISGVTNVAEIAIALAGTNVAQSVKPCGIEMSGLAFASAGTRIPASTMAIITVNGSQAVTGRWRRSVGSATHSAYNKNLIAIRIL